MTEATRLRVPFGELAGQIKNDVDWKMLFEAEHQKRRILEGEVGNLKSKLLGYADQARDGDAFTKRHSEMLSRISDMRRSIAARLMGALLTVEESTDGYYDIADMAVAAADALIVTLQETKAPSKRPKEPRK